MFIVSQYVDLSKLARNIKIMMDIRKAVSNGLVVVNFDPTKARFQTVTEPEQDNVINGLGSDLLVV